MKCEKLPANRQTGYLTSEPEAEPLGLGALVEPVGGSLFEVENICVNHFDIKGQGPKLFKTVVTNKAAGL